MNPSPQGFTATQLSPSSDNLYSSEPQGFPFSGKHCSPSSEITYPSPHGFEGSGVEPSSIKLQLRPSLLNK